MCDVALLAMPGRGLATLVRADVVMTGGDTVTVTQQHPARGPHCPPRTCPAQPWPGTSGAEEMEYSSTWSDRIHVYTDAKKYDVLRRIHNAIIVEIRSIL